MPKVEVISYKGMDIVFTNLKGLSIKEAEPVMERAVEVVSQFPKKSVYSLIDFTNMRFNKGLVNLARDIAQKNGPYVKATAAVGLNATTNLIGKTIVALSSRNAQFFKSLESGKDWLYEQSQKNID